MRSFIRSEQFPYETATGWVYDSGDYHAAMKLAMEIAGYDELRREQQEKLAKGEVMGIGVAFFTEGVGAGPRRHMDILGLAMNDGAELRIHPSGRAVVSISAQTSGQGHETTFAQIVAEELGISPNDVVVRHGDTDKTPYGLGTYGSRSIPVSGGAVAVVSRKVRDKARQFAALMLETRPEDLAWEKGRWYVKGDPEQGVPIEAIAAFAHSAVELPARPGGRPRRPGGLRPAEPHVPVRGVPLGRRHRPRHRQGRRPPLHRRRRLRRADQPDDRRRSDHRRARRGDRAGAHADHLLRREGKCLNASMSEYLLPTALECPEHGFELGSTVTPCPHHPIGAKGVGESPGVGSPPCIANAVVDALYHARGITDIDIPCTPSNVWAAMRQGAT